MLITLDTSTSVPIFEQLTDELRAQIVNGALRPSERLPSARDLARALELNVHTVLRAYQALREEGLIIMRPGRGAQVRALPENFAEIQELLKRAVLLAQDSGLQAPALITTIKELY